MVQKDDLTLPGQKKREKNCHQKRSSEIFSERMQSERKSVQILSASDASWHCSLESFKKNQTDGKRHHCKSILLSLLPCLKVTKPVTGEEAKAMTKLRLTQCHLSLLSSFSMKVFMKKTSKVFLILTQLWETLLLLQTTDLFSRQAWWQF